MLPRQAGKSRYRDGSGSPRRCVVVLKASLASSLGRQVGPEITGRTKLRVAFALLVTSAMGAHPHVGGSTAENCAAWGSRRWVTRLDMLGR
jgi:hypothetical protein